MLQWEIHAVSLLLSVQTCSTLYIVHFPGSGHDALISQLPSSIVSWQSRRLVHDTLSWVRTDIASTLFQEESILPDATDLVLSAGIVMQCIIIM
jgi:hypothetical protein